MKFVVLAAEVAVAPSEDTGEKRSDVAAVHIAVFMTLRGSVFRIFQFETDLASVEKVIKISKDSEVVPAAPATDNFVEPQAAPARIKASECAELIWAASDISVVCKTSSQNTLFQKSKRVV